MNCPKCGYDGSVGYMKPMGGHTKQLNPYNPYEWICGNCGELLENKK